MRSPLRAGHGRCRARLTSVRPHLARSRSRIFPASGNRCYTSGNTSALNFCMPVRTSSAVEPPKPKSMLPTPMSRSALMSAARSAGGPAVFAVTGLRWRGLAEHRDAQAQADRLGIASRFGRHFAQAIRLGLEPRQAIDRILRVGTDRVPGIAEAGSPPQRRAALASDPDRRVRLLHGLRVEADIGESDMLAVEL